MKQFGRFAEVVLPGLKLDSDNLTINFEVPFDDDAEPNESTITIYNLKKDTINRIKRKDSLTLNAGYRGDVGVLLSGFVSNVFTDFQGVDKITTIHVLDSPALGEKETAKKSYKKNTKASQIISDLYPKLGLTLGALRLPKDVIYKKGYTSSGKIVNTLAEVAKDCGASFYVNKRKLYIRSLKDGDDTRFTLSHETGLIGSPSPFEEDFEGKAVKGFKVSCLLQYRITTASILNIQSKTARGSFRARNGVHKWNSGNFVTEMDVV